MPVRKHDETIQQFAIRTAWEYGHFWNPNNPDGLNVTQADLAKLQPTDPVVVDALISLSKMDAVRYTNACLDAHGRAPQFDGVLGPAMGAVLNSEGRCPVPDYAPPLGTSFLYDDPALQQIAERMQQNLALPATGSGSWPNCHNVGNFHCCTVGLDTRLLPSFLKPVWTQVLTNVRQAYAGVGLLFKFIENGKDVLTGSSFNGVINTALSFVTSSSGWIGLAIVGQNERCNSTIWCRFLATYQGGSTSAAITTQWTTLVKHELGHNCGRGHTSGGVMNPSIVNNLPVEWTSSDPSTTWLKQQFGGVPVPIPGNPIPPLPPTPPGTTIEQRMREQEVLNAVQQATIQWCVNKIKALDNRNF
jgi:hypothetical protein